MDTVKNDVLLKLILKLDFKKIILEQCLVTNLPLILPVNC